jgi:hypothetical protein
MTGGCAGSWRPDAECRVEDSEPFAEIIDADEGIPAAHGNLHSSSETINVVLLPQNPLSHPLDLSLISL